MSAPVTVLVADDHAATREALRRLLSANGYRVLEAADGLQALATCRHERPDVAVVDMVMPHLDGIGVARALRSDQSLPYIPILFYSSRDGTSDRVTALRAGGDDFVGKGADDEELLARVEVLSRTRKLLDARRRAGDAESSRRPELASPDAIAEELTELFGRARATGEPLSVLAVEVEGDPARHGIQVATALSAAARGDDIVGTRLPAGWIVILPSTHFGGAMASAERIWRLMPPRRDFPGLAIGAACSPNPKIDSAAALLETASAALARARAEGPAHVCLVHHQAYLFRPD